MIPHRTWQAALATLLCGFAHASPSVPLHIEAQPLEHALRAFTLQSGLQLLFPPDELSGGRITPEVSGSLPPEVALHTLLADSGLQFQFVNQHTVAIRSKFVGDDQPSAIDDDTQSSSRVSAERADGQDSESIPRERSSYGIPEVLVEGSRSLNADIERTPDDIQPYVVLDRKMIEAASVDNVEDLLKTRLTMNYVPASYNQGLLATVRFGTGNQSNIALGGLDARQTLILIDGRRPASYALGGNLQQPDLNGIPLSAIERIEVLPATASGIYGGSATGGVVNVVLRRDYVGWETKLQYQNTDPDSSPSRSIEVTGGFKLLEGRTTVLFRGSYAEDRGLLQGQRDFYISRSQSFVERFYAMNPQALRGGSPPLSSTTNVSSARVFDPVTQTFVAPNLVLKSGQSLGSAVTFLPEGYSGSDSDILALVGNAGRYNLQSANTASSNGLRRSLLGESTVDSVAITVRHEISPRTEAYLDLSISRNYGIFHALSAPTVFTINADAPNNPFLQRLAVAIPLVGFNDSVRSPSTASRALVGFRVNFSNSWNLASDFTFDRTDVSQSSPASLISTQLTSAIATGSIDVLRDSSRFVSDLAEFELSPDIQDQSHTLQNSVTARLAGPLVRMNAGDVTLSILAEWRRIDIAESGSTTTLGNGTQSISRFSGGRESVSSLYGELLIPVVSELNRLFGVEKLDVQLATRFDEYQRRASHRINATLPDAQRSRNVASSTNPTVGLRYSPVPSVSFRASYGTGFFPPSLTSLQRFPTASIPASGESITDPKRNNELLTGDESGLIELGMGGNPDLRPEESESHSVGVVLTPIALDGFRASFDWTKISKTDNVTSLRFEQDTIDLENELPSGIIIRDPATPENDPQGYGFGPIVGFAVEQPLFNAARARYESVNMALNYTTNTPTLGSWEFSATATRLIHRLIQISLVTDEQESRYTSSAPKWRANGTIYWRRNKLGLSWATQYLGPYFVNSDHTFDDAQQSDRVPVRLYHDFTASYDFGNLWAGDKGWLGNLRAQIGVRNVFNKAPHNFAVGGRFYDFWGDPMMRTYTISITAAGK